MERVIVIFRHKKTIGDAQHTGLPKASRSTVNIEADFDSIRENAGTSSLWMKIDEAIYPMWCQDGHFTDFSNQYFLQNIITLTVLHYYKVSPNKK